MLMEKISGASTNGTMMCDSQVDSHATGNPLITDLRLRMSIPCDDANRMAKGLRTSNISFLPSRAHRMMIAG